MHDDTRSCPDQACERTSDQLGMRAVADHDLRPRCTGESPQGRKRWHQLPGVAQARHRARRRPRRQHASRAGNSPEPKPSDTTYHTPVAQLGAGFEQIEENRLRASDFRRRLDDQEVALRARGPLFRMGFPITYTAPHVINGEPDVQRGGPHVSTAALDPASSAFFRRADPHTRRGDRSRARHRHADPRDDRRPSARTAAVPAAAAARLDAGLHATGEGRPRRRRRRHHRGDGRRRRGRGRMGGAPARQLWQRRDRRRRWPLHQHVGRRRISARPRRRPGRIRQRRRTVHRPHVLPARPSRARSRSTS